MKFVVFRTSKIFAEFSGLFKHFAPVSPMKKRLHIGLFFFSPKVCNAASKHRTLCQQQNLLPGRVPFDNIRSHTSGHVFSLRQRIHIFFHKVFRDAAMGIDADQCLCRKGINDCIPATALYLPLIFYNFYIKKEIPIFFLPFLHHFPRSIG